jgi:hypothetical protein
LQETFSTNWYTFGVTVTNSAPYFSGVFSGKFGGALICSLNI